MNTYTIKPLAYVFLASVAAIGTAHASLVARGTKMVYDDVNNITWVADANLFKTQALINPNLVKEIIAGNGGVIHDTPNDLDTVPNSGTYSLNSADFDTRTGEMSWWGAQAWIGYLNKTGYKGYSDWALPTTASEIIGYGPSQMSELFYNQLGGVDGSPISTTHNANYNLFTNVQSSSFSGYFLSGGWPDFPEYACVFKLNGGYQTFEWKRISDNYAWAVRPGDVTAVPDLAATPVPDQATAPEPNLTVTPMIVAGSFHTVALKANGTVFSWGSNQYGQLGNGTRTDRLSPVRILGLTNVKAVSAGLQHTVALKTNGTVAVWGRNNYGQLGNGTNIDNLSPVDNLGLLDVARLSARYN